jgi:hypothetical protein
VDAAMSITRAFKGRKQGLGETAGGEVGETIKKKLY